MPAEPISGLHQAGVDRAQRMAQMLEQRHLQTEMAAAAHLREDRRHELEVPGATHAERAHTADREARGDAGGGDRHRRGHDPEPHDEHPAGEPGHLVDVTA